MQRKPQLDARQTKAIELFANGGTDAEVAAALNVERSTVWRWRTLDRNFRGELRRTHAEATKAAAARVEGLVERAIDVISQTLGDDDAPLAMRLRAAEAVLDRAGIESSDVHRRVLLDPLVGPLDEP